MRRHRFLATATVVAVLLTACSPEGGPDAPSEPVAAQDGVVALTGTDRLRWSAEEITADTGDLSFELTCEEAVNHNLVVDDRIVAECTPGNTATGNLSLDPGEYRFVCNVPGHERTMQGTLTVS